MSFLNKLFSFFHGGDSASDTSTDPAYAYLPDNIFHGTSVDPTRHDNSATHPVDTVNDPAYAALPENVHHEEEMIASVTDATDVGWSNTDSFSTSIFDDSFSSSSFADSFGSGFDSGFSSGSSFGSDF